MAANRPVAPSLGASFLSAPFETGGWEAALRALAHATRSGRGQLIAVGGPRVVPFNKITDASADQIRRSMEQGLYKADVNWRIAATGRPLEIISESHYRVAAERISSDIYDEFAEWFGCQFGCQTVLYRDNHRLLGMAVLRDRDDGETTAEDRDIFAAAAPHVLTAVRLQRALEHEGARLLTGAYESKSAAAFICDNTGLVMALTPAADEALRERPVLKLSGGRLSAIRPEDDRAFQNALSCALRPKDSTASDRALWLQSEGERTSGRICEIFSLPAREWGMAFAPSAIVVLRRPSDPDVKRGYLLSEVFKLTSAEAEIATLLAAGLASEEIALRRNVAVSTVSTQLKSIFSKTGACRQAELVALVNRLLR